MDRWEGGVGRADGWLDGEGSVGRGVGGADCWMNGEGGVGGADGWIDGECIKGAMVREKLS